MSISCSPIFRFVFTHISGALLSSSSVPSQRRLILYAKSQLNLYEFTRITESSDKGAYYHELFIQDKPFLCTMMKRNKIKGVKRVDAVNSANGSNKPSGVDAEEDVDSEHENLDEESQDDDV
jgi:hypothetical protein